MENYTGDCWTGGNIHSQKSNAIKSGMNLICLWTRDIQMCIMDPVLSMDL